MSTQAIRITFKPATPYRRAVWLVKSSTGWLTYPFDYSNQEETKEAGLAKLLIKLGLSGEWSIGGLPDGSFVAVQHSPNPISIKETSHASH